MHIFEHKREICSQKKINKHHILIRNVDVHRRKEQKGGTKYPPYKKPFSSLFFSCRKIRNKY